MKTIRSDQGQEFRSDLTEYDLFLEAQDQFDHWDYYQIIEDDRVIETVLNPQSLTIVNLH